MSSIKTGTCTYCGKEGRVTSDHVPPRNLFPTPRPDNLLTVPACPACHGGTSADDEYLRDILTFRHDTHPHPDVAAIYPAVLRSFTRPQKRAQLNRLMNAIEKVEVVSPAGLFLGNASTFSVDHEAVHRVVNRTIRGLFRIQFGEILPPDAEVDSFLIENLDGLDPETKKELEEGILGPVWGTTPVRIGDVFEYRVQKAEDEPDASAWILLFFGKVGFLGMTFSQKGSES